MMRKLRTHYGLWGTNLPARKFAFALAAAGTLFHRVGGNERNALSRIIEEVKSQEPEQALLGWEYLPPSILNHSPRHTGERMANLWLALFEALRPESGQRRTRPRLRIDSAPGHLLPALLHVLSRAAASVWSADARPDELEFSWPINIGFLDDVASIRLRSQLERHRWNNHLFRLRDVLAGDSSTVLVLPSNLGRSIDAIDVVRRRIDTGAVLVLGGRGRIAERDMLSSARHIQRATASGGIAILERLSGDLGKEAITRVVGHLAHGLSIDSVITEVAKELKAESPFMAFDPRMVRGMVVPSLLREFSSKLVQTARIHETLGTAETQFTLPLQTCEQLGLKGMVGLDGLDTAISERIPSIGWKREHDAATVFADLRLAVEPVTDATSGILPRYLQARLIRHDGTLNQPSIRMARLEPEQDYLACVRVGHADAEWDSLDSPIKLPPFLNGEPHRVDIWFWEPRCAPQLLSQQLSIPSSGSSLPCYFAFRTPSGSAAFCARIVVVHRGAILQSGELRAEFGGQGATEFPKFRLVMAAQMSLDRLQATKVFDGTLLFDLAEDGNICGLVSENEDKQRLVRIDAAALDAFTQTVGAELSKIASKPEDYTAIDAPAAVKLLGILARHGAVLYENIAHQTSAQWLESTGSRLNVAVANGAHVPLEFVYQAPAPEKGATLCSGHRKALVANKCCGECEAKGDTVICPMAFWGVSRVLERQCDWPEGVPAPSSDEFRLMHAASNPSRPLFPLKGAQVAASNRAISFDNTVLSRLCATASRVCGTPVDSPVNWVEWVSGIKSAHPSALMLLPHHETAGGFDYLQVGSEIPPNGDRDDHPGYLSSVLVKQKYVRDEAAADVTPIVVLLGCDTQAARIRFESFINRFRGAGAEVVIATVSIVLGRHAGPTAEAFLEEMSKCVDGTKTIGDVLQATRRRQLLAGVPMVLGLAAYGGVDRVLRR